MSFTSASVARIDAIALDRGVASHVAVVSQAKVIAIIDEEQQQQQVNKLELERVCK